MTTACSLTSGEDVSEAKIYGGTAVTGTRWSSAVALRMGGSLCTGTLVAPTLVITAAHCLDRLQPTAAVTVVFGNSANGGRSVRAASFGVSPDYRDNAVTDIAYVKLAQPVTDVEIIQVATDQQEIRALLAPGARSTLVGFGTTERGSIGTKFEAVTTVGPSRENALFIGGGGKDTCQGDSGGPAYGQLQNGEWRVYGITSRGNGCGQGGLYARMHDGLCWIQRASGVAVPGSKLQCPGVPNVPGGGNGGGATVPTLNMLLATADADYVDLAVAAGRTISKVSLCLGSKATCLASRGEDIFFSTMSKTTTDRLFYFGQTRLTIQANSVVTLLGFDAQGTLVESRTFSFQRI